MKSFPLLLLALAAEPSSGRSLRAAGPDLGVDDVDADSMALGDLDGEASEEATYGGEDDASVDDASVADLEDEEASDDADDVADSLSIDAEDSGLADMEEPDEDTDAAPMTWKMPKRSAKPAAPTTGGRAARAKRAKATKVRRAAAMKSLVHQKQPEIHLRLMNAINVMRAEFCLRRPDLMQHEKCLNFLMDRCAVESSGYGYCREFESILRKQCADGNGDVAHHKSGCELHNELCNARSDCDAVHQGATQPPPQAAAPTTLAPTTAAQAPTLLPTAAPTTAAPQARPQASGRGSGHPALDPSHPAYVVPVADSDVAATEEELNGALETDYSQPDHFHEDTHGSPSPATPFTGDKLIGNGQPDQGYNEHSTKHVKHEDDETMTSDWRGEWPQYDESEDTSVDNICKKQPELKWCRLWMKDRGMVTTTVAMPLMHHHSASKKTVAKKSAGHKDAGHKASGHKTAHKATGKAAHDSERHARRKAGHEASHKQGHTTEHAQGAEQGAEQEGSGKVGHGVTHKAEHRRETAEHEHEVQHETKHEAENQAATEKTTDDDADDSASVSGAIDDIDESLPGGMAASSDEMGTGTQESAQELREAAHVDDAEEAVAETADATEESIDEVGQELPPGMLGTPDDESESKSDLAAGDSQTDLVHDDDDSVEDAA